MVLLSALLPKPTERASVTGTVARFGMSNADERRVTFCFTLQGSEDIYEYIIHNEHDFPWLGLVKPGDAIVVEGLRKGNAMERCTLKAVIDGKEYETDRGRLKLWPWS